MTKFTSEEKEILYHAAKMGLSDAGTFDALAFALDISDAELIRIRDKLDEYLKE